VLQASATLLVIVNIAIIIAWIAVPGGIELHR